jgi:hypothetical protein
MIVAIFGTTISPYLFFWQSSQEVEEIDADAEAEPLKKAPEQARPELKRIRWDTFLGMAVSNIVAIAIVMSTAATLHVSGKTEIGSDADVAEALKPLAGDFAFVLFSLGIIGTGLLSIPIFAGSAAYALGESQHWKCGLENKPWEAQGFYSVIAAAIVLGLSIEFMEIDPISALFWSAVINEMCGSPNHGCDDARRQQSAHHEGIHCCSLGEVRGLGRDSHNGGGRGKHDGVLRQLDCREALNHLATSQALKSMIIRSQMDHGVGCVSLRGLGGTVRARDALCDINRPVTGHLTSSGCKSLPPPQRE